VPIHSFSAAAGEAGATANATANAMEAPANHEAFRLGCKNSN
jgi:hypothetical protein